MEIKVRDVGTIEEKSIQEKEQEILKKDEEVKLQREEEKPNDEANQEEGLQEIKDEDVLSYLGKKFNKEISSFDELFQEKVVEKELPEDISTFLKFKEETGRGLDDFIRYQKNYDDVDENQLLREFYKETENNLDDDDIDYLMEKFSFDEELDDEKDIKRAKIEKKKELAKAKEYFNKLKEQYKVPVVQSGADASSNEDFKAYQEYLKEAKTLQERNEKLSDYFQAETDKVFSNEFKGFEFNIGEEKVVFKPGDAAELKQRQSDISNFISKYLDENGAIKDAPAYHKALSAAMNPDRLAQYFYEKGKSDATKDYSKESKNIDMTVRSTPQAYSNSGLKVRAVDTNTRDFKIRKR